MAEGHFWYSIYSGGGLIKNCKVYFNNSTKPTEQHFIAGASPNGGRIPVFENTYMYFQKSWNLTESDILTASESTSSTLSVTKDESKSDGTYDCWLFNSVK